jgi:acetyltransferase-like isoleucine patch superfamily enzyme
MNNFLPKILRKLEILFGIYKEEINRIRSGDMCLMGEHVRLVGNARVRNFHGKKENICIGQNTVILGEICTFNEGAKIVVGADTYIGPGSNIWAFESIEIGNRVQVSFGVNIHDNDSHSASARNRCLHVKTIMTSGHPHQVEDVGTGAIVIEDDAWIGFGSTILKGVKIGKGAIIGACSVITKDVPEMTIVAGNPQRVVGRARE